MFQDIVHVPLPYAFSPLLFFKSFVCYNYRMKETKKSFFNKITQILLPLLTIAGFALTSLKYPAYGLTLNLLAQIFWLYAGWKAWKNAGQIGIFITSIAIGIILIYGVINYFFFS